MSSGALLEFNLTARNELIEAAGRERSDTEKLLRSLAAELAMGNNSFDTIMSNHGLDQEGWNRIKVNPRFLTLFGEASVEWGSTANAAARIKAKAESMVETALPTLYELLVKGDELTPSKVKLVEALMKGAGVGVDNSRQVADGVSIVINMDAAMPAKPSILIDHEAADM